MRNLHQEVTDRIIAGLETGTVPWIQPWSKTPDLNWPCIAVTNRPYSGVNVLLLWLSRARGWSTPRFLTFKQATEVGRHVRKGEHGVQNYFVKNLAFTNTNLDGEDDERRVRLLKRFVVFNVDQCGDLPEKITRPPTPQHHDVRDLTIEEFLTTVGIAIRERDSHASYAPGVDIINMPPFGAFASAAAYYGTLFHELIHVTGHKSRLNNDLSERFSKPQQRYAAEELVAELGNAFLAAEFGIDGYSGCAACIAHWIKLLKDDPKAIFIAASRAQQAVDYLRQLILAAPAQAVE